MIDAIDSTESTLRHILWNALKGYSSEELFNLVKDRDYIVRTAAAKQLQLRPSLIVFNYVKKLCDTEVESNREIGAFILGQLGTPDLPYKSESLAILNRLISDDSTDVKSAAIAACGHLGNTGLIDDEAIIEGILRSINDKDKDVRISCAFAICSLKPTEEVVLALNKLLSDEEPEVVEWAEFSKDIIKG
jgi:HEAT repeat protein